MTYQLFYICPVVRVFTQTDFTSMHQDLCQIDAFSANSSDLSEMVSFKLRTAISGKTRPDCSRVNTLESWEVVSVVIIDE